MKQNKNKRNEKCPSYDEEFCETYPAMFSVKCENTGYCKWKDYDFTKNIIKAEK